MLLSFCAVTSYLVPYFPFIDFLAYINENLHKNKAFKENLFISY